MLLFHILDSLVITAVIAAMAILMRTSAVEVPSLDSGCTQVFEVVHFFQLLPIHGDVDSGAVFAVGHDL